MSSSLCVKNVCWVHTSFYAFPQCENWLKTVKLLSKPEVINSSPLFESIDETEIHVVSFHCLLLLDGKSGL
jgi:hypothetical protein